LETASHAPLHAPSPLASGYEPSSTSVPASSHSAESTPDEARLNQFVEATERYRPQLIWLATRIVNRTEEAEDIVQQALLKAFRKLSGFRGESQMRTWLNAIVKNTAREYMRGQRGRTFISLESPASADEGSDEMEIVDRGLNPEEYCEHREREQILAAAIGGMGPTNREVVEMCVFQELPYMEVATTLNVSLSTVKSRMFRSRRDLRMALSSRTGAFR
jgi:RNA polymerase sigma-70 factor (ECF subfamily)